MIGVCMTGVCMTGIGSATRAPKVSCKGKKKIYNQIPHKNTEITDTKNMSHLLIIAHRFLTKWSTQA
jgi:hypothetical protein